MEQSGSGRRVLVCFDFAYGYPVDFPAALQAATGKSDSDLPWLMVWQYLSEQIKDDERTLQGREPSNRSNRFEVANRINAAVLESLFDAGFYLEATYPIRSDETKGEGEFGSNAPAVVSEPAPRASKFVGRVDHARAPANLRPAKRVRLGRHPVPCIAAVSHTLDRSELRMTRKSSGFALARLLGLPDIIPAGKAIGAKRG